MIALASYFRTVWSRICKELQHVKRNQIFSQGNRSYPDWRWKFRIRIRHWQWYISDRIQICKVLVISRWWLIGIALGPDTRIFSSNAWWGRQHNPVRTPLNWCPDESSIRLGYTSTQTKRPQNFHPLTIYFCDTTALWYFTTATLDPWHFTAAIFRSKASTPEIRTVYHSVTLRPTVLLASLWLWHFNPC